MKKNERNWSWWSQWQETHGSSGNSVWAEEKNVHNEGEGMADHESVSLEMLKTQQNVVALSNLSRVVGLGNLWRSFPNSSENQGVWIQLRVGICGGLFCFLFFTSRLIV